MTESAKPRIVSLVPSLTELICELGLRDCLVGRTGFCIHPRNLLADVPKVGGTKAVDVERIRQLRPTHLVVSQEENTRPVVEELAGFVPEIVVTHVITLEENLSLFRRFGEIFDRRRRAEMLSQQFEQARSRLSSRQFDGHRVLYLIWKSPWMTVTRNTFISQMLQTVGLNTVPAVEGATDALRYPVLTDEEFAAQQADMVLLSSEPFRFGEAHKAQVRSLPAMADIPVHLIDGEMTSWYGSRAIAGLHYLADFRDALDGVHAS